MRGDMSYPCSPQDETAEASAAAGQPTAGSTNGSTASAEQTEDEALDKLFRDPAVQEMLYAHLPESMRNKETFEWMLNNPEYRKQLQDVLKKQVQLLLCLPHTVLVHLFDVLADFVDCAQVASILLTSDSNLTLHSNSQSHPLLQ